MQPVAMAARLRLGPEQLEASVTGGLCSLQVLLAGAMHGSLVRESVPGCSRPCVYDLQWLP